MRWDHTAGRDITARQRTILRFIAEQPVPPTIREIGDAMDISSTSGVNDHLNSLLHKGYIERTAMKARNLFITAKARRELGMKATLQEAATDALTLLEVLLDKPLGERFDKVVKQTITKLKQAGVR